MTKLYMVVPEQRILIADDDLFDEFLEGFAEGGDYDEDDIEDYFDPWISDVDIESYIEESE